MRKARDIPTAEVVVRGIATMRQKTAAKVIQWLRSRANYLEKHRDLVDNRKFTQRLYFS